MAGMTFRIWIRETGISSGSGSVTPVIAQRLANCRSFCGKAVVCRRRRTAAQFRWNTVYRVLKRVAQRKRMYQ
jgi:hypothetical protein